MAYEPKVWQCGEVVSAEALNHLEQGVADASECCEGGGSGGAKVIKFTQMAGSNKVTANYTSEEILQAMKDGDAVFVLRTQVGANYYMMTPAYYVDSSSRIYFFSNIVTPGDEDTSYHFSYNRVDFMGAPGMTEWDVIEDEYHLGN